MIILPDKNIVRTKFLIPVPEFEWRDPSQAQQKDQLGNSVFRTSFRIRARLNDGFVKWTGWFDSRNDYDAFLWAIVTGMLKYQKEIWKLPTPQWHPDIGIDLISIEQFYEDPTINIHIALYYPDDSYFYTVQPTIWNINILKNILYNHLQLTYNQIEVGVNDYIKQFNNCFYYINEDKFLNSEYFYKSIIYPHIHAMSNGKWIYNDNLPYSKELIDEYNIDINIRNFI